MAETLLTGVVAHPMVRKNAGSPPDGINSVRNISHELFIGGLSVDGFISWTTDELADSAGTSSSIVVKTGFKDWVTEARNNSLLPVVIDTIMTIGAATLVGEEFSGVIDSVDHQPLSGVYNIHLSSYARLLVQKKVDESIAAVAGKAKLTGQVVEDFTKRHGQGLKTSIDPYFMTSGAKVGTIFKNQQVLTLTGVSVWDLFQSFAQQDHADCYVKGDTLYYVRRATDASPSVTELGPVKPSYVFTYGYNILDVSVQHSPLFSNEITVTVRSYVAQTQQTNTVTKSVGDVVLTQLASTLETTATRDQLDAMNARSAASMTRKPVVHKKKQEPRGRRTEGKAQVARIGTKENYTFVAPGLSQEDCDRLASKIAADIAKRTFIVELKVLAQPDFNCRQYIALRSMPEDIANQSYAIKSINKSGGGEGGYVASFTILNHVPQSTGASLGQ